MLNVECTDPKCRCSSHPEYCCTPESIQQHKDDLAKLSKKRKAGTAGTSAEAVGN